jgi:hypothetical protein
MHLRFVHLLAHCFVRILAHWFLFAKRETIDIVHAIYEIFIYMCTGPSGLSQNDRPNGLTWRYLDYEQD